MTQQEYRQFNAFTRYDGLFVGILMSMTFVLMMYGIVHPETQFLALAGLVFTPIFVYQRIKSYRDGILGGLISYRRSFVYSIQCFLYGSLILALVSYFYMRFLDNGAFLSAVNQSLAMPETIKIFEESGLTKKELDEVKILFEQQRPIDVAFSLITNVVTTGAFVSLFIAMIVMRSKHSHH